MKNPTQDRTHDLPICNAVPKSTPPPNVPCFARAFLTQLLQGLFKQRIKRGNLRLSEDFSTFRKIYRRHLQGESQFEFSKLSSLFFNVLFSSGSNDAV
jgi:hypothetical protein